MKCHIWFPLTCPLGLEVTLTTLEVEHHVKLLDHGRGKFAKRNVHVKSQPVSSSSSLLPALVQLSYANADAQGA